MSEVSHYSIGINEVTESMLQLVTDAVDRFHPESIHIDVDGEFRFSAEAPQGEFTAAQKQEAASEIERFRKMTDAVQFVLCFHAGLNDEEELELADLVSDYAGVEAMNF